ncbi:uncharacterized protein LOC111628083 [Centruroides sculpturatus]|uniref:uncharacterized protein LOC111628083 n=1 Tax=Centruroides sculpturatus TaxID=218467 RepID=UPI000C6E025F|nr:uncharacterized protein LOC111628083 [Centruroides sculpturatus]
MTINHQNITTEEIRNLCSKDLIPPNSANLIDSIINYKLDNYLTGSTLGRHPGETSSYTINVRNNHYSNSRAHWNIYTDGSRNDKGTGAAFVIYDSENEIQHQQYYRLHMHCTNNQAELLAVYKALSTITKNRRIYDGSICINTDSMYVINVLSNNNKCTRTGMEVRHLARNLSKFAQLSFTWVPGHTGNKDNEHADALAKKVTTMDITTTFSNIPIVHIKNNIRDCIMEGWQKDWATSTTGRTTHKFLPSINKRQALSYFTISHAITQCLTGHGNFSSYLTRFKRINNDRCSCDGISEGDALHYIFHCMLYER